MAAVPEVVQAAQAVLEDAAVTAEAVQAVQAASATTVAVDRSATTVRTVARK